MPYLTLINEDAPQLDYPLRKVFNEVLFRNISFSFGDGDRVGIVGNNGAGKSTLLYCVAGLIEPTEGSVLRAALALWNKLFRQSS